MWVTDSRRGDAQQPDLLRPAGGVLCGRQRRRGYWVRGANILWVRPGNSAYSCNGSWSADGKTFSWWNTSVDFQLNRSGVSYTVVALIPLEE